MTGPIGEAAHILMGRLVRALQDHNLEVIIWDPSTKIEVNRKRAASHHSEIIVLRPDAGDRLCWQWLKYGTTICEATDDVAIAVARIIDQVNVIRA
jgi:hypothetical protein